MTHTDLLGTKVQSAAPWAGHYVRPFYPHEIDAHPDCARIAATVAEAREAGEAAEDALEEAKQDTRTAEEERDMAKGQLEAADERIREAEADLKAYATYLEDLAVALLNQSGERLRQALIGLGKYAVEDLGWSPVDAAELEGLGDYLAGVS